MANSSVAIIILNWNGYNDTCECVDSVLKIDYPNYEIIVVDNGSSNGEVLRLKERYLNTKGLVFIESSNNLGYCGGNNLGYSYAKANKFDFVLVLNNDTIVKRDFLSRLVESSFNFGCSAVGSTIMDYKKKTIIQNQGMSFNLWTSTVSAINNGLQYSEANTLHNSKFFSGACFLARVKDIGEELFDEDYFCYFEEIDLCLRLHKKKFKTMVEVNSIVYHKGSVSADSIKGFSEQQMAKNRFLVIKKNASCYQRIVFILFMVTFYWYFHIFVLLFRGRNGLGNIKYFIRGMMQGFVEFYSNKK